MKKILILIAMLCLLTGCFGNDNKEIKKNGCRSIGFAYGKKQVTQW